MSDSRQKQMSFGGDVAKARVGRTAGGSWRVDAAVVLILAVWAGSAQAVKRLDSYYAHPVHEDVFGVIAPWYQGLNGQIDERIWIAVDVMKRYPWVGKDKAVLAAPDFIYNSHWGIKEDGTIFIPPTNDWMCGDLSQRAWSIIKGLTAYYAYSSDPIAFVYIPLTADYILDYALTPADHPWPNFPISTPILGKAYGKCEPGVRNQLDLCAVVGTEMLRAYKLTGNKRYFQAAKHWGDVFAQKCNFQADLPPWNRYVDPAVVGWSDELTGSTALILDFLEELIRLGHRGPDDVIVRAREAGVVYLRDQLLDRWLVNDTWGRNYWDWDNPVQCGITSMIGDYILKNRQEFGNWRVDLRNILSLIFNRNGVDPGSQGEMYSGAWAFPESSTCCGTSLSYNQYTAGPTFLRYGVITENEWAKEVGRRMMLMATYDSTSNGVVKDGLFGAPVATGEWSNLAHPWPLCQLMEAMGWLPEVFGANRENHIVRSSSVISTVVYEKGRVWYRTFDAPRGTVDVLRLAFVPTRVTADGQALAQRTDLAQNGFTVVRLGNGDAVIHIRHDGSLEVMVEGDDPQETVGDEQLTYRGNWQVIGEHRDGGGSLHVSREAGAVMQYHFRGNQVRLIGRVGEKGGLAEVYLDGKRQAAPVDFWNPVVRHRQVVFTQSGLKAGEHKLRLVVSGKGNPISGGSDVYVDGIQYSAAEGDAGFGQGGGPAGYQRMIFGYPKRKDYIDCAGRTWRPATEFVIRSGYGTDAVKESWWTARRSMYIGNTQDEELYRYGVHGPEFWVNLTVAPGRYYVTLKFADTPLHPALQHDAQGRRISHTVSAFINGQLVLDKMNIPEAAGGLFRAADFTFGGIEAQHGAIEVYIRGHEGEAILQALEIGPQEGQGTIIERKVQEQLWNR